jgi:hypothetical protein
MFSVIESPEFISVELDSEEKVLGGRKTDGTKFENVGLDFGGALLKCANDYEERTEITTDSDGKIVSYRDKEGLLHENAGIATNHLELGENATEELIAALDALGYTANNPSDWSDSEFVEIPIPEVCAVINIEVDGQAESKGLDIHTHLQFWDKNGNYFRKPIILNAQGDSSLIWKVKNQGFDFTDDSKLKIGNWVPCDSFHIKKYFIDVFRGQCVVGYHLVEQVYQTRPYAERRPWDYLNEFSSTSQSKGDFAKDFDTGALAHPDGFPVKVFFNGKNAGIYAFNLKKARENYYAKKNNQKNIILDGSMGAVFFNANGDTSRCDEHNADIPADRPLWTAFEIRNPKISKDINGNKYDGDNPTEPSDDYLECKNNILRLTKGLPAVNEAETIEEKRAIFETYFHLPFIIDYELIAQVFYHWDGYRKNWIWCCWDGNLWAPTLYDLDSIFGMNWDGLTYRGESINTILCQETTKPTGMLKVLYKSDLDARYKELRDKGIFSVDNIVGLMEEWVKQCGYDNLKEDINDIIVSPYYDSEGNIVVDKEGNPKLLPYTPSYRDGSIRYAYTQNYNGGWYNSVQRIKNWL